MATADQSAIIKTAILALVVTMLFSARAAGTGLFVVAFFVLLWLPYCLYVIFRKPEKRSNQTLRLMIWIIALAVGFAIHQVRKESTRAHADEIVHKIEAYIASSHRCPSAIEQVGLRQEELRTLLGVSGYYCQQGKPQFYYGDPMLAFNLWEYDFARKQWVRAPD